MTEDEALDANVDYDFDRYKWEAHRREVAFRYGERLPAWDCLSYFERFVFARGEDIVDTYD